MLAIVTVGALLWRVMREGPVDRATSAALNAQARAALAEGRAHVAEQALRRACELDPSDSQSWRLRLQILRIEDRPLEAIDLGWKAHAAIAPAARAELLRDLTLALLAEAPDDLARRTLESWAASDPDDLDARVALERRRSEVPREGDPSRAERISALEALLELYPDHLGLREALILDVANAGDPDRGRALLDAWPSDQRDVRYDRLRGRWDLEYDAQPLRAVEAFRRALAVLPHDWSTRYRLSRALHALGRHDEAQQAATTVRRLREALDPARLGPRLDADLAKLEDPRSRQDLADLCDQAGLTRLADAWRQSAAPP